VAIEREEREGEREKREREGAQNNIHKHIA